MPIDDRTTNRSYKLPNAGNFLADDVQRLRDALTAIDADVFARYTKAETDQKLSELINGAPNALDTLNELAAAMGNDPNFAATITNALANKPGFADIWTRTQADARYVQGVTQTENVFTGTGSQTTFTLTQTPPTRESLLVTVDGVVQPTTAYNLSGSALILSEAPASGASIRVLMLGVAGPVQSASTLSFTQAGTGAVTQTVDSKLKYGAVSVKDFGAKGDNSTNDTDAFAAASAYLNSQGGGTLIIPPGTYIVGKQTFANGTGKGYSYQAASIISFSGCTKPVVVEGNGAVLKMANGLRIGSFNPTTGASYTPGSLPFTNYDYKADPGTVVAFTNCKSVSVRNLEIDGNIQNLTLGGQWGDTGRQCAAYGVYAYTNENFSAENVYVHHHGLDGVILGHTGLSETSAQYPQTLINVISEYNARQGLSWVGGTQLTAINCKFNHTGKSTFGSAPQAGVDIEAESSVCRNGMFINCEMQNNAGVGMVADVGDIADVAFHRCKFIGQSNYAIWPYKPRLSFVDCLIVGAYVNPFSSANKPEDATKFQRCLFTDESKYAATLYNIGALNTLLSGSSSQGNVVYDSCSFVATRSKAGRFDGAILRNATIEIQAGTSYCVNQDWHAIFWGSTLENVVIKENITTNIPADSFYIDLSTPATSRGMNQLISANGKLKWFNWSWGHTGLLYNSFHNFQGFRLGNGMNGWDSLITWGTAAPTSGTWANGDRVVNVTPAVGQPKGWICTVGGTPGTWVSEGNL